MNTKAISHVLHGHPLEFLREFFQPLGNLFTYHPLEKEEESVKSPDEDVSFFKSEDELEDYIISFRQ